MTSSGMSCSQRLDESDIDQVPHPWTENHSEVRVFDYSAICGNAELVREQFERDVLSCRRPAVLRGLDLGSCVSLWSAEYLAERVGSRPVTAHVCRSSCMQYAPSCNYRLCRMPFDELMRRCQCDTVRDGDERYYLRTLDDEDQKRPAQLYRQYPELSGEFFMPRVWPLDSGQLPFSSVLRVSSARLRLWAHYDVMDNVLVQVRGSKRILLFAPSAADRLYLRDSKCSPVDLERADTSVFPRLKRVRPVVAHISAGDVVFIPALWFHSVTAHQFSVAVNIFWRHLPVGRYQPNDVFGNKDPLAAAQALTTLAKAMKHLSSLPAVYRDFYGRRMISDIENELLSSRAHDDNDNDNGQS